MIKKQILLPQFKFTCNYMYLPGIMNVLRLIFFLFIIYCVSYSSILEKSGRKAGLNTLQHLAPPFAQTLPVMVC